MPRGRPRKYELHSETHKRCYRCLRVLPLTSFQADKARWDGKKNRCGKCHTAATREKRARMTPAQREAERERQRRWFSRNRDRHNASQRARKARLKPEERAREREKTRLRNLRRKYGLADGQYQKLLAAQRGACAACGDAPKRRLAIDHCHNTGSVRGLLCHRCNLTLGFVRDSERLLLSLAAYLRRHYLGDQNKNRRRVAS